MPGPTAPDDPSAALAARLCKVVPALADLAMRTALVLRTLEDAGPPTAARALDEIASRAEQTEAPAREVLAALLPLLGDPLHAGFVGALRVVAKDASLLALGRLLRRKARHAESQAPSPIEHRGIALEPGGRPLSLGERRALARKPSRGILDKLLADPHPRVIENLLANPRLTEDDVVRIAAKRPQKPEIASEVARSARWMARARVRMALVLNPGTPPELSVPVLSQLLRHELADVAASTQVPAVLRSAALDLLARRPPLPPDPNGGASMQ
ncbi:hypothetical protein [Polyangium fumosum]|uniref:DUF2336 domain-containing protein n=1 Tax=Polyangium fumosum TaxID=889272 RepID=A0A4U1JAJ1_9BACT|nr:hypothetical protein [Polyangium fumosum]TKD04496.1 hypothetical protein E8A74_23080 [Polyangium fumosum]